jgi:hypothetical protein
MITGVGDSMADRRSADALAGGAAQSKKPSSTHALTHRDRETEWGRAEREREREREREGNIVLNRALHR